MNCQKYDGSKNNDKSSTEIHNKISDKIKNKINKESVLNNI